MAGNQIKPAINVLINEPKQLYVFEAEWDNFAKSVGKLMVCNMLKGRAISKQIQG